MGARRKLQQLVTGFRLLVRLVYSAVRNREDTAYLRYSSSRPLLGIVEVYHDWDCRLE